MTAKTLFSANPRRVAVYWITAIGLLSAHFLVSGSSWRGSVQLHTIMEVMATLLAAVVGVMALVRYYSKPDNTFLFIGTGFLGTAFLDAYHAVVTSSFFQPFMPSDLPSLAPWSWVASRQFLSIMMLLSVLAWLREEKMGPSGRIGERTVYVFAAMFTVLSFLFFAFVPLPQAYFPGIQFSRPEEFGPAFFFLLALAFYLTKGHWREDAFEHWLVLSLIVGVVGQAVFMSQSKDLFDYEFDIAHLLKKAAYICILVGLLVNMLSTYRQAEERDARFRGAIAGLQEGFALYDANDRLIVYNDEYLRLHTGLGDIIKPGMHFEDMIRANAERGYVPAAIGRAEEFVAERMRQHRNPTSPILRELTDGTHYLINESRTPEGGIAVTQTDITDLKQAETALRESEKRNRAIVDNIIDGIVTIDEKGTIRSINQSMERIFGYGRRELIGQNVRILAPEPYRGSHDQYLATYRETGIAHILGKPRELEAERNGGISFPVEITVTEINLGGERLFIGIIRDITERREMDRMKGEFVSTVSHELRTPLTSIRGSLGLVTAGAVGELPEKVRELVELAEKNTERLIRLVNDILDMEKLGSGRMTFEFQNVSLDGLVRAAIAANQGFAEEFDVSFQLAGTSADVKVHADSERIIQVISNLLSNAAKFSPAGDVVDVTITAKDGMARVSVSDHGPGIDDAFHGDLFSRFTQGDSSDTRKAGGTGLGLHISKTIVERHGGRIDFDTEVGAGTTFFFELPMVSFSGVSGQTTPRKGRGKGLILVCEDDPDVAGLLAMMLEKDGYSTDIAYTAGEAAKLLKESRYDAMTLDILLPDDDGMNFLRRLRAEPETRHLPVVYVSAVADERRGEITNGAAVGVVDCLRKPIDPERLRQSIANAVEASGNGLPLILHIEDDIDIVTVVREVMHGTAEVVAASTVAAAKAKLAERAFDLILIDVKLPDGSGLEVLKFLREDGGSATPAIILSADDVAAENAEMVNAALIKSKTSNAELIEAIRSALPPAVTRDG